MTNLLEAAAAEAAGETSETKGNGTEAPEKSAEAGTPDAGRPSRRDAVPEKFRDPETGDVRVDALAKSYRALERKLSEVTSGRGAGPDGGGGPDSDRDGDGIPDGPDGYAFDDLDGVAPDAEANALMHEIGLTRAQARALYGYAARAIAPRIRELQDRMDSAETADARSELERHFGSGEAFADAARQIQGWARNHLPREVVDVLSTTPRGIIALEKIMQDEDPALLVEGAAAASLSEAQLEKIMDSPKFWRDQDPKTVELVRAGFKRLYPG